ncbi:hypothetical protein F7725_007923 [Dissostichus mawsoni]|uniref:small monomeric GTPase n=1 Tax=Dissostichus mawsoni TaxID=36200 RepID=A0A7J5Y5T5_DISMA|nr:hypothetical protein F7725_007923 [Dissostichus mawsoni]
MAKQYDVLFRLLMLGDSGVGKTCMLRRFTESEFDPSHISTIAGQERYQTITKQYYRRAQGIIFVYDITSESSFQHLMKWVVCPDKVQRVLIGNKSDEELSRQVTKDQGSKLAETYGMEFFETSASTSSNISEAFTRLTELVLQAHHRDVDNLLGALDDYLDNHALEEENESEGTDVNTHRTCAC